MAMQWEAVPDVAGLAQPVLGRLAVQPDHAVPREHLGVVRRAVVVALTTPGAKPNTSTRNRWAAATSR